MWYFRSLECAGVIQKLTILEHKNGLVLSNTRVPVSGTWSKLCNCVSLISLQVTSVSMASTTQKHALPARTCHTAWMPLGICLAQQPNTKVTAWTALEDTGVVLPRSTLHHARKGTTPSQHRAFVCYVRQGIIVIRIIRRRRWCWMIRGVRRANIALKGWVSWKMRLTARCLTTALKVCVISYCWDFPSEIEGVPVMEFSGQWTT